MSAPALDDDDTPAPPRMLLWLLLSVALFALSQYASTSTPGGLLAVSLHKMHLMSLAGWGGYWLDRALFPYARPHTLIGDEVLTDSIQVDGEDHMDVSWLQSSDYHWAMMRRALIVVGCLVCIGLGA